MGSPPMTPPWTPGRPMGGQTLILSSTPAGPALSRSSEDRPHADRLRTGDKGTLRFPLDRPVPYDWIERVVAQLRIERAS